MTYLFIHSFLWGNTGDLRTKLAIVGIMWMLVAAAVVIDLASGVRKARERGEVRTSLGFRQTVSKIVQYYAFLVFAFIFDCLLMFILVVFGFDEAHVLPFSTIAASCFLVFIEWKSFLEKANDKYKKQMRKSLDDLGTLLENRDDLVKGLTEIIKKQIDDKNEETNA